jgi:hypothetical protein
MSQVSRALAFAENVTEAHAATGELLAYAPQLVESAAYIVDVSARYRDKLSYRPAVLGDREPLAFLDPLEELREMRFGFVGADIGHRVDSFRTFQTSLH